MQPIDTKTGRRQRNIRRLHIVIPVCNESANIGPLVRELVAKLSGLDLSILFVDDGSTDETLAELQTLRQARLPVDYISFSRNFGKEAALMAGFMLCPDGFDALVTMDGDGQHPPQAISEMVSAAEQADAELVIGIRDQHNDQNLLSRQLRRGFYVLFNAFSQTTLPYGIGDFNLYRPAAAKAIRSLHESDLFLKGLVAWIGFNPILVSYEVRVRANQGTRWTFRKLLKLTANGLLSFTDWPLRVWSLIGAILAIVSFAYLTVTLIQVLIFGSAVKGYPSLIMTILGLGGLQLLSVGILGAYIGRTYMEGKQRPRYIVKESSLEASLAPQNISQTSTVQ